MDDPLRVGEPQGPGDVLRDADQVGLGEGALAGDPRAQGIGATVHGEVHVAPVPAHRANPDDVGMLEPLGGFGLVAKAGRELGIQRVLGLQDLDGDRGAIGFAAGEDPGKASLAQQVFQPVGAQRLADEVGRSVGHRGLYRGAVCF